MASYAASAHLTATRPHLRAGSLRRDAAAIASTDTILPKAAQREESASPDVATFTAATLPSKRSASATVETADTGAPGVHLELLRDEDGGLEAWLEQLRVTWDQTTWYLFHAEGWR